MKKHLFYTFLVIFALTALITLLGISGALDIKDQHLNKLLYALILEVIGCVIVLFKKANFFDDVDKNNAESPDISVENFDRLREKFGFIFNSVGWKEDILIDGNGKAKTSFELEVVRGELSSRGATFNVSGDSEYSDLKIDISGTADGHKVENEIIRHGNRSIETLVRFSPSLKKGEKASYEITREYAKGLFLMTYEDIVKQIEKKVWGFSEPFEFTACTLTIPTKKLLLTVNLPPGYQVSGKEFFDVFIVNSYERIDSEFKRIKESKFFSSKLENNTLALSLCIEYPEYGMTYVLKWIPPPKAQYEKLRTL